MVSNSSQAWTAPRWTGLLSLKLRRAVVRSAAPERTTAIMSVAGSERSFPLLEIGEREVPCGHGCGARHHRRPGGDGWR